MNFVYCTDITAVVNDLSEVLLNHLQEGEKVIWLLSGGSNLSVAVEVARKLHGEPTERLSVSLVDERYGDIGHPNENWQQLIDAGFSMPLASLYRPLSGQTRAETAEALGNWLGKQFGQVDYAIGLLGIGSDGHTSGIKAGSQSTSATGWTTEYSWQDYERITTTFDAIRRLDEVFIQAIGSDKAPVVHDLLYHDIDLTIQPAQVLKQVKKSTLYTDYKEGKI